MMAAAMFSTAGVPPFVGFWAKLQHHPGAAGQRPYVAYAIIAVAASVVGAFYYLRVVKLMYFEAPVEQPALDRPGGLRLVLGLNALAIFALGLAAGRACSRSASRSFQATEASPTNAAISGCVWSAIG